MLTYMSTCGLVLCVMWTMPSRRARLTRSPRAMSTDDWVMPLMSLCVLTTAASAPAVMASTGSSGQKRRCGPHAWSVTNGTPARCASVPMAGQVGAEAVVGGRGDEQRARLRRLLQRRQRVGGATWSGMPQSGSMAGSM